MSHKQINKVSGVMVVTDSPKEILIARIAVGVLCVGLVGIWAWFEAPIWILAVLLFIVLRMTP